MALVFDSVGYDIIGDIHGQHRKLLQLLAKLGYVEVDGCFRHPSRKAAFVGDFIDRGPAIRQVLRIVKRMVDENAALAVLGNHEFNALRFAEYGDSRLNVGLRSTLGEFSDYPSEWRDFLRWFRKLPPFLDLEGFRVIHALWDPTLIEIVQSAWEVSASSFWREATQTHTPLGQAVEVLLNGHTATLPENLNVQEFEGSMRSFIRIAWWKNEPPMTYRGLSMPFDPALPEDLVPPEITLRLPGYGAGEPPLFLGHYALPPDLTPWPQAENIACVDYRAAKRGPLVAYRWNGEQQLRREHFVASE